MSAEKDSLPPEASLALVGEFLRLSTLIKAGDKGWSSSSGLASGGMLKIDALKF